ncbi:MAG: RidA family protein [Dehalococcoidales bacterium]|nr:RidA family protein [Dehalococcoidales bacterium]
MLDFINLSSGHKFPYSAAVKAGGFIFVSPQGGRMNHDTNEKMTTIEGQAERCLIGVEKVLKEAGASLEDVVMLNVLLTTHENSAGVGDVCKKLFPNGIPARTTLVTQLPHPEMLSMIGCTAYKVSP